MDVEVVTGGVIVFEDVYVVTTTAGRVTVAAVVVDETVDCLLLPKDVVHLICE